MINLTGIPDKPGCYLFKDRRGRIIYVGKSRALSKRVKSYFSKNHTDEKTKIMIGLARSVEFIVTRTEVEALILENNLIKKHMPKYNINLKDSKRYAYIELTREEWPRLLLARTRHGKGKYFGPFTSAAIRDMVMDTLKRSFPIRTCKRIPKRACLRYHIGLCPAPCVGKASHKEYMKNINVIRSVLSGKTKEMTERLTKDMRKQSHRTQYERALELRDQIRAISWMQEKQTMERQKRYDEDVINHLVKEGRAYLMLFNVHRGVLENKQEYEFEVHDGWLEEFLVQYYSENKVPREVILPAKIDTVLGKFLAKRRGGPVRVVVPLKGEKKRLLELVTANIQATFFRMEGALEDLRKKLKLQEVPSVIECFDISHLGGTSTTASMVQFRDGRPDKSGYRRFKIRSVEGIDDFAAIAEVVRRRYTRLLVEKSRLPDLIVIDGGKGQLSSALNELGALGLRIPTISLAKKFEEIYVPGLRIPLHLDRKSKALQLLQQIRDEAHRFAIKYNRVLRSKRIREDK